jgi:hypothetical protein
MPEARPQSNDDEAIRVAIFDVLRRRGFNLFESLALTREIEEAIVAAAAQFPDLTS